jgi:hypothetical protein
MALTLLNKYYLYKQSGAAELAGSTQNRIFSDSVRRMTRLKYSLRLENT